MLWNAQVVHTNADAGGCHPVQKSVTADTTALFVTQNRVEVQSMARVRCRIERARDG